MFQSSWRSWLAGALIASFVLNSGCNTPLSLSGKKSPHEKYTEGLWDAGLATTALGKSWMSAAASGLARPVAITLPYRETGFFAAEDPRAAGFRFMVKQGEQLTVGLQTTAADGVRIFVEIWLEKDASQKIISYNDTLPAFIRQVVDEEGYYLVRIQPELLQPAGYTLTISTAPSLAFPVRKEDNPTPGSFWGAARDGGGRSHEGVDIFAKKGTPAIAIAPGRITRVTENRLGGKVVFMRPNGKDYSLYYAHLDSQLVTEGQRVQEGDIIGQIGNTGNARTIPAHLHFGIYTQTGAVDPWPFINVNRPQPGNVTADTSRLGSMARVIGRHSGASPSSFIEANTTVRLVAAATGKYRVRMPDGNESYLAAEAITSKPLRTFTLKRTANLQSTPSPDGAIIEELTEGSSISLLSSFGQYSYVSSGGRTGWITGI